MKYQTATQQHIATAPMEVSNYAERFDQLRRATAGSIIEMGKIVCEAKTKLADEQFEQFCSMVGYERGSSSIRKLEQIGKKSDLLSRYTDKLPSTWTTLYSIAQLGHEIIEEKIESGEINASMSGEEAKQLVGKIASEQPKPRAAEKTASVITSVEPPVSLNDMYYKVCFDKLPSPDQFLELENAIFNLRKEQCIDCRLYRSPCLITFLSTSIH